MQARNPNDALLVDLSKFQDNIDWPKLAAATVDGRKVKGVMLKATEGHTYEDPKFGEYLAGAKSQGLDVGVYHFFRAQNAAEAKQEAAYFASIIKKHGGWDIIDIWPAIDVETKNHLSQDDLSTCVRVWVDEIKKLSGLQPRLYTYPSFADNDLNSTLSGIPLWFADYSHQQPPDHNGWKHWDMLQFTSNGHVDGISGLVDMDEYDSPVLPGETQYPVFDDAAKVIVINGSERHEGKAFISKGESYIPLRFVSEALGDLVSWDGKTKTITVRKG